MKVRWAGIVVLAAGLGALSLLASVADGSGAARPAVSGTLWVANRGEHSIRSFDTATGAVLRNVPMRPGSQPGDLAAAKGKLYVSEETGDPPAIAIVDGVSGDVVRRIWTGLRPHHVHASPGGNLVAYGLFGTNRIGVIDARSDTPIREWRSNVKPEARAHAGVFSPDGRTIYVAHDVVGELTAVDALSGSIEWTMVIPGVHELAISHDGRTAYVSARGLGKLHVVDLVRREIERTVELPAPDTLRLSKDERLLTVGLRVSPARVAVVDTADLSHELVTIGGTGTIAGHQWTAPMGDYTFAAVEGAGAGVAVIDHANGHSIVDRLDYPGRPHGVAFLRD